MKRSELTEIIKSVVIEMLPDLVEVITEQVRSDMRQMIEERSMIRSEPDLDLIRSKFRDGVKGDDKPYGGTPRRAPKTPNNPKSIVDGEQYASGKGIMEWFTAQGGKAPQTDAGYSQDDMDEFMKKRFGV